MNHHELTIGMIGGGNMARALVRGLLRGGHPAQLISIAEPEAAQRELVAALAPGLVIDANNTPVAQNAAVLVLAVKPQTLPEVATALAGQRRPAGQLVMSVAAGITLGSLAGWLGATTPLVRVMPNQPATIGAGVSALAASTAVDAAGRELAEYVAGTTGRALWLQDETLMDAVTAVSGSGPAYFYLLMEHMEHAAIDLGLSPDLAAALVRETALGAARVVCETKGEPGTLRATVTSPGGTTAAALRVFEQADLAGLVRQALTAARDRSAELGKQRS
ncbi:MAG: pyrroline-5-carboxylate reductase [Gammaproteobacteria bacterium]|jgi:pyrroline-5-carboxylate reductase|nr:pyrroline-5-carboxylate reductase [Gammaproteobacteria bacterium]